MRSSGHGGHHLPPAASGGCGHPRADLVGCRRGGCRPDGPGRRWAGGVGNGPITRVHRADTNDAPSRGDPSDSTTKRKLRREALELVRDIRAYLRASPADAASFAEWQGTSKAMKAAKDDDERSAIWDQSGRRTVERPAEAASRVRGGLDLPVSLGLPLPWPINKFRGGAAPRSRRRSRRDRPRPPPSPGS